MKSTIKTTPEVTALVDEVLENYGFSAAPGKNLTDGLIIVFSRLLEEHKKAHPIVLPKKEIQNMIHRTVVNRAIDCKIAEIDFINQLETLLDAKGNI